MAEKQRLKGAQRSRLAGSWPVAAVALLVTACCISGSIKIGRVSGFMSGVMEVSIGFDAAGSYGTILPGGVGGWADLESFDEARITTDLSAAAFSYKVGEEYDVDLDASAEELIFLRAETSAAVGGEMVFVAWEGDKWTVDKGVCYLGWMEEGDVKIAASYCGVDLGTMYCTAHQSNDPRPLCETCSADGMCSDCDMGKSLDKCLPPKSVGGSVDLDIDIDMDIDIDVAADDEPGEV